jgi:hypothetical protein
MKFKAAMFAFALLFAGVTMASAQDSNIGTWKLNEAKSQFGKGATKNHTVVYEMVGDETKVIVDGTDPSGNATHSEWTGKFDGRYYAVTGDPGSDTRAYRIINKRTLAISGKKGGKVSLTGTITIARGGKTRTVITSTRNSTGRWIRNTAVYDKQ